jgi:hypothetical protein
MQAGVYVDPSEYYEAAAEHCAQQGYSYSNPMLVRALVRLPDETYEAIEADPDAFARRVADYAYGAAMAGSPDYS